MSKTNNTHFENILGEVYLSFPTIFIDERCSDLLPHWLMPPQTLVLVCLCAQFNLESETNPIAVEKERLYNAFQRIAAEIEAVAAKSGILIERICPKTGLANYAPRDSLIFDLVNIFYQCLGFPYKRTEKGCKVLSHPQWQQACYPGLLISAAESRKVASLVYNALSSPRIEQWSKLTIITSN